MFNYNFSGKPAVLLPLRMLVAYASESLIARCFTVGCLLEQLCMDPWRDPWAVLHRCWWSSASLLGESLDAESTHRLLLPRAWLQRC